MKTTTVVLTALAFASGALASQSAPPTATPSKTAAGEAPQTLEKFMVTGSLAAPAAEAPMKLEKFMVTGSLANPAAEAPMKLEKFMVTGSRAKPLPRPDRSPARLQ
jgi:hypothetical protein